MTVKEMAQMGGYACAKVRSPQERTRIARKAVNTRWKRFKQALKAAKEPTPEPTA